MINEEISKETVDMAGRVTELTMQEVMKILQKFVEDTKQNMNKNPINENTNKVFYLL